MPLFEFVCSNCGKTQELLVRGGEEPVCPGCGSKRLDKQAGRFAAVMGASSAEPASCPVTSCCRRTDGSCPNV